MAPTVTAAPTTAAATSITVGRWIPMQRIGLAASLLRTAFIWLGKARKALAPLAPAFFAASWLASNRVADAGFFVFGLGLELDLGRTSLCFDCH